MLRFFELTEGISSSLEELFESTVVQHFASFIYVDLYFDSLAH